MYFLSVFFSVKTDPKADKGGNDSAESYQSSTSEFSDDDMKERASDVTGDNAMEVRVSSSTPNDQHNSENDQDSDHDYEDHNNQNEKVEKRPEDEQNKFIDNKHTPGDRTKHDRTLNTIEDEEENERMPKIIKQKKKYFIHNWDEYDPVGWKQLPLLPSPQEGQVLRKSVIILKRKTLLNRK